MTSTGGLILLALPTVFAIKISAVRSLADICFLHVLNLVFSLCFSVKCSRVNCVSYISCCQSVFSSFGSATPHATKLFFYFFCYGFYFHVFLYVFPFFQCGDFGHLSSTCLKPADSSKSSSRRDWLDSDSSTCDEVECDLIHLLSCCGDEFSAEAVAWKVACNLRLTFGSRL